MGSWRLDSVGRVTRQQLPADGGRRAYLRKDGTTEANYGTSATNYLEMFVVNGNTGAAVNTEDAWFSMIFLGE